MHVNFKSPSVQACLLVIASVSMSGCASVATFQDWQFCYANKSRAAEARKLLKENFPWFELVDDGDQVVEQRALTRSQAGGDFVHFFGCLRNAITS